MIYFPTFAIGFTQGAITATSAVSTLVANVVRDFFIDLFMNPGNHYMAVVIMCVVSIAACVGTAYLVKLAYEKYFPESTT